LGLSVTGLPPEPKTILEALNTSKGPDWQAAVEEEVRNVQEMHTWEDCELPAIRRAWACGFSNVSSIQIVALSAKKIDWLSKDTNSNIVLILTNCLHPLFVLAVRLFFSIVAASDLVCHMVDISNAFAQSTANK
jgi:hypothetical protein